MFSIPISSHPLYTDISRNVSVIETLVDEQAKFIKLKCVVHHWKDGYEFKDMNRFISLLLDNTKQYPNPAQPGTTIGDYDAFMLQAEMGMSMLDMVANGITAVDMDGTINAKCLYKTLPEQIKVDYVVTHESEVDAGDGEITLETSGGIPPLTYSWSNGATTKDLTGLTAGVYTVTVSDANTYTDDVVLDINVTVAETPVEE